MGSKSEMSIMTLEEQVKKLQETLGMALSVQKMDGLIIRYLKEIAEEQEARLKTLEEMVKK